MRAAVHDRWFSRPVLALHTLLIIWVPGCAVATWWQVTVALGGDSLGWLYSIEWPIFAVLGTIAWWQLIHDRDERSKVPRVALVGAADLAPASDGGDPDPLTPAADGWDEDLDAYNAYLAELAERGTRKSWGNPLGAR